MTSTGGSTTSGIGQTDGGHGASATEVPPRRFRHGGSHTGVRSRRFRHGGSVTEVRSQVRSERFGRGGSGAEVLSRRCRKGAGPPVPEFSKLRNLVPAVDITASGDSPVISFGASVHSYSDGVAISSCRRTIDTLEDGAQQNLHASPDVSDCSSSAGQSISARTPTLIRTSSSELIA
jgi:hypothetical protein